MARKDLKGVDRRSLMVFYGDRVTAFMVLGIRRWGETTPEEPKPTITAVGISSFLIWTAEIAGIGRRLWVW